MAFKQTNALSPVQLRDVQDTLRKPLTGRRVLIPVGSKAFVTGELRPGSGTTAGNEASSSQKQQTEMIQLRSGGEGDELITIARRDAVDRIQQEIQALRGRPTTTAKPTTTTETPQQSTKSSLTSSSPVQPKTSPTAGTAGAPNYFEIREEINEEGQEVHAEAVDITNHLKLWEQQVNGTGGGPTSNGTSKVPSSGDGDGSVTETSVEPERRRPRKEGVSDEEFAKLSARLDELARLEEEEETKQASNRQSAKKLQSRGWAKGFLNNNNNNKKKSTKPSASARAEIPILSETSRAPEAVAAAPRPEANDQAVGNSNYRDIPANQSKRQSGDGGRVAFTESNQVHEIPRIGQRSVSEIQKPAQSLPGGSAISPVVRERPRKNRPEEKSANSSSSHNDGNVSRDGDNDQPQQRKLSRFAQQRLGQS